MDKRIINDAGQAVMLTTWHLQFTIPSVLAAGEEFQLRITAFGPDGLPSGDYDREIVFEESPGIQGRTEPGHTAHFLGKGNGSRMNLLDHLVYQHKICDGILILLAVKIHFITGEITGEAMVIIQHAGDPVETESVKTVLIEPVTAI